MQNSEMETDHLMKLLNDFPHHLPVSYWQKVSYEKSIAEQEVFASSGPT